MTLPLLITALFAQAPLTPNAQLPPGHPPLDGTQAPAPAVQPPPTTGALPPNHPSLGKSSGKQGAAPTMEELLRKLDSQPDLATREKSFELAVSIGRLYYGQGRFRDASIYLEQAMKKAEPARALYLAQRKAAGATPLPAPDTIGCAAGQQTLDALFKKAQEQKGAPAVASCARAALEGTVEVETLLGHTKFLQKDGPGALAVYTHALETFEANAEARYSRAALLLDTKGDDVKALKAAQADFERFLADAPNASRAGQARRMLERTRAAITAGGVSKLPLAAGPGRAHPAVANEPAQGGPLQGGPQGLGPSIAPDVLAAFQDVKVTVEMEAQFVKTLDEAEEHLAKGRYQQALDAYQQVMPFKPEPRVQAGMAWTLVRLGKPTADRIWVVASQSPDVVSALGDRLKEKGDADGAKLLWRKLAETVPAYAPRLQGKM